MKERFVSETSVDNIGFETAQLGKYFRQWGWQMNAIRLFGAVGLVSIVAACATVTRGTTNQIQIVSEPSGASVRTSMNQQCTTPCTLTVGRKDEFNVVVSLAGYADQTVEVRTRVAGAGAAGFVGNVVVGGIIGMGADAATGATLEHFPNPIEVKLARTAAPAPARRR